MSKFDKIFETKNNVADAVSEKKLVGKSARLKPSRFKNGLSTQTDSSAVNKNTELLQQLNEAALNENEIHGKETEVDDKKRGRPATGKRNDPNYLGFTTYIRKETHTAVKIALLQEGARRELSELVEDLLQAWVKR